MTPVANLRPAEQHGAAGNDPHVERRVQPPMIAVNDQLGFRPVEHQRVWQGPVR
jgi:hypothetical protein